MLQPWRALADGVQDYLSARTIRHTGESHPHQKQSATRIDREMVLAAKKLLVRTTGYGSLYEEPS